MDYFKKFQIVKYDFTTTEAFKQYFTLADVTTRVQAFYNEEDTERLFDNYNIKSWDTPEKISYSLYGTTEYYWTILYVNDMFDMYYDWPLLDDELQKYAESIYTGFGPSPLITYAAEVMPYVPNQFIIKVVQHNTIPISESIILHPDKLQVGMFVDRYIAGEDCRITNIDIVYRSDVGGGNSVVDYYELTIDKPTLTYAKEVSVSSITSNIEGNDNIIFFGFAEAIEDYNSISYYMTADGVIKDIEYVEYGETIYGITKIEDLIIQNEKKKRIKIIRPDQISNFVSLYFNRVI